MTCRVDQHHRLFFVDKRELLMAVVGLLHDLGAGPFRVDKPRVRDNTAQGHRNSNAAIEKCFVQGALKHEEGGLTLVVRGRNDGFRDELAQLTKKSRHRSNGARHVLTRQRLTL